MKADSMSGVQTTFLRRREIGDDAKLTVLPYLTEREADGILDAIDAGHLRAVANDEGAIVAVMEPERAIGYAMTVDDNDARDRLYNRLREAADELKSLQTIIGEVMAEKYPRDFRGRLEEAADDVRSALDSAIDASENLA